MHHGHRISPALLLAASALTAAAHGQTVPKVQLDRPAATFPEPLSQIRGLRELSDGRVVVTDMIESAVRILDFRSGQFHDVGRQGEGPGEFGMPGELFAAAGDTTLMMDMGNRRLMIITPQGRMLDDGISVREAGGPIPVFPRGVDAKGNMYYDLSGIVAPGMQDIATKGRGALDSVEPRDQARRHGDHGEFSGDAPASGSRGTRASPGDHGWHHAVSAARRVGCRHRWSSGRRALQPI